ncbi:MAG: OmpA family protein [Prevotellaceae bacterium]|nr:OmpA family protein [Candidatus Faecinaster equi]
MSLKKFSIFALCAILVFGSCGMNNTTKGGLIGGGGGAALGALIGHFAGNTAIGAVAGAAIGTGAGVLIGKKMDKAKAAAQAAAAQAKVEEVTDANGLKAVKVTFDSGILFATNKADLNTDSKNALSKFAEVLRNNADMDIAIIGHTDNTGTDAINDPLSLNRAKSVESFLSTSCGVNNKQIKVVQGKGSREPIASNDTKEGQTQNRRVEIFMYASQAMIEAANAGTLQ